MSFFLGSSLLPPPPPQDSEIERVIFYSLHAVGNRDGGEAATTRESTLSDARHAVGNRDGGQAAAISEFANSFISVTCALNVRKVPTCIL